MTDMNDMATRLELHVPRFQMGAASPRLLCKRPRVGTCECMYLDVHNWSLVICGERAGLMHKDGVDNTPEGR